MVAAELLAPSPALFNEWHAIRECLLTGWIDNMSALSMLVSGSARADDLSALALHTHFGLALARARAWWEYVESESNPSDGGSRVGVVDKVATALGVELHVVSLPPLPPGFPSIEFSAAESTWPQFA